MKKDLLAFDVPIVELEEKIAALQGKDGLTKEERAQINELKKECDSLKKKIYAELSPWEIVQVARHPARPQTIDYINTIVEDFVELHGDRNFKDDRAMITGLGTIDGNKVLVIGHHKGKSTRDKVNCYFGCAHPEGYRKALLKMKLAEKFGVPIISFIDTPGAYPGIGAEERGQHHAIAYNLMQMANLRTPVICVVIGEGGSGGALGIGVGNKLAIMEYAYLSVISPEGCAAILWKSSENAAEAAVALKLTAKDLKKLEVVDDIIPEPLGGAHRDQQAAAENVKKCIVKYLKELAGMSPDEIVKQRYEKIRSIGFFNEKRKGRKRSKKLKV